jgi:hypothetical protein
MTHSDAPIALATVRRLAIRAGFGHSVDLAACEPGSRKAAYYVSKYVTKATDCRESVPWAADLVDLHTGEVTRGVVAGRYRTWSMSREWGDTMAAVRARAGAYAALKREERSAVELREAVWVLTAALGAMTLVDGEAPPGS